MTKNQLLKTITEEFRTKLETVLERELDGCALTMHIHNVPVDCFSGETTPVKLPKDKSSFMVEALDSSSAILIYSVPIVTRLENNKM